MVSRTRRTSSRAPRRDRRVVAVARRPTPGPGGTSPPPRAALVAAVVLAGGLVAFRRECRPGPCCRWSRPPLGLHDLRPRRPAHDHGTTAPAGTGWTWQMVAAHPFVTLLTAALWWAGGRAGRTSSARARARAARPRPRPPASRPATPASLAPAPAGPSWSRSAPGGPADLSPVGLGSRARPQPPTDTPGGHVHPYSRAPRRAPDRPRGDRPVARRTRRGPRDRVPSTAAAAPTPSSRSACGHGCEGSPTTKIAIQIPSRSLGDADPQPLWDVEAAMERPDEPVTDAHGNEVTERVAAIVYTAEHPAARRAARQLRAVLPAARRRGRDATFPTVQTCRGGRDRLDPGPGGGPGRRRARQPGAGVRDPAGRGAAAHGAGDDGGDEAEWGRPAQASTDGDDAGEPAEAAAEAGSSALGSAGLVAGLLGLAAGGSPWPDAHVGVTPYARPAPRRRAPHWWVPVAAALVALALVLLGGSPAAAHAELVETDPAEGAVVETAPETVTLTFNEPVRLTSQEVAVYDAGGEPVDSAAGAGGAEVTSELPGRRARRRHLCRVMERPLGRRPPDLGRTDLLVGAPSADLVRPAGAGVLIRRGQGRARRRHRRASLLGLFLAAGLALFLAQVLPGSWAGTGARRRLSVAC